MKRVKMTALSLSLLALGWAVQAQSAILISVDDGVTGPITIADNSAADGTPDDGVITYSTSNSTWTVEFVSGAANPDAGSAVRPEAHLSVVAFSSGAGTMRVMLTDDVPGVYERAYVDLSVTPALGGTGLFQGWEGDPATPFDLGSKFFESTDDYEGFLDVTGTGRWTLVAELTHTTGGFSSVDYAVRVPEPTILGLLGIGLLGLGAMGRRAAA